MASILLSQSHLSFSYLFYIFLFIQDLLTSFLGALPNLGINGPYKSAKKVHYKSAKNLPVFLKSDNYKINKDSISNFIY